MNIEDTIRVLSYERTCVMRQIEPGCDRNCAACDLVLPDELVISAYQTAINILRAQQEVERRKENEVMGLDEAIEHLGKSIPRIRADGCEECAQEHEQLKAWLLELAAFRAKKKAETNEPLTEKQLLGMNGMPVYDATFKKWCLIKRMEPSYLGGIEPVYNDGSIRQDPLCGREYYIRPPKEAE